jgi:TPR repeat protein
LLSFRYGVEPPPSVRPPIVGLRFRFLANGDGVAEDLGKAVEWYRLAAAQALLNVNVYHSSSMVLAAH